MRYVRWRAPEVEATSNLMLGGFGILMLIPQLILLLIKTRFIIPRRCGSGSASHRISREG